MSVLQILAFGHHNGRILDLSWKEYLHLLGPFPFMDFQILSFGQLPLCRCLNRGKANTLLNKVPKSWSFPSTKFSRYTSSQFKQHHNTPDTNLIRGPQHTPHLPLSINWILFQETKTKTNFRTYELWTQHIKNHNKQHLPIANRPRPLQFKSFHSH